MFETGITQAAVFFSLTALVALITYIKCRQSPQKGSEAREYFLAGGSLSWVYVAGSLVMTNISAEQIVGMNGVQKLLIAWWEIFAAVGLIILAKYMIPIYFENNCTTTPELLEKKYHDKGLRSLVSSFFLLGYLFILLPTILYTGSLFMVSMFQIKFHLPGLNPLMTVALFLTVMGGAYAIFGGLRAIAVSDSLNSVTFFALGSLIAFLSLQAINWDFSGIPMERLTLIGTSDSEIPLGTLFTGMIFIQIFYWGTNMVITQRALGAKSVEEAQKALYVTALVKVFIPLLVVLPGIVAFKLYGNLGDASYGRLVDDLLPPWLSGAFAAAMTGAILSSFNSCLNAAAALYTCDIHKAYINEEVSPKLIGTRTSLLFAILALSLVPFYQNAQSIIALLQKLNGLYSMPVLSAFICAFCFHNVSATALKMGMFVGFVFYSFCTFVQDPFYLIGFVESPLHYIHLMFVTLVFSVVTTLFLSLNIRHPERNPSS